MTKERKLPKYKIGQRVQERKKAQGGISNRDIRAVKKRYVEGFLKFKNERKYTIVGGPKLGKPDDSKFKRQQWEYEVLEDGKDNSEKKLQGMLQPLEEE